MRAARAISLRNANVLGRIIGAILGYFLGKFPGALLGFAVGYYFDRGLARTGSAPPRSRVDEAQQEFFKATFQLLGHLAKADGRVSEAEIARTEQLMASLQLSEAHRRDAIALFKQGVAGERSIDDTMIAFMAKCGRYPRQQQLLLEFVCHLAFADGELHSAERQVLATVARWMGIGEARFDTLLGMFSAQYGFSQSGRAAPGHGTLEEAYRALGVDASSSDRDVKQAYRRLMSQHHPDKLIAQGVPEDMVRVATEKSQEIRAAWDTICKARGI